MVEINTLVVAASCTSESSSKTVELPRVSSKDFHARRGTIVGLRNVVIKLTDCTPMLDKITLSVSGLADEDLPSMFKNTASSQESAIGVGLIFMDSKRKVQFNPDGSVTKTYKPDAQNNAVMDFIAGYIATRDEVIPGTFKSYVTMRYDYE
ncbi:fimbrial protein [Rosenbergiella nectarea]|uniref:fimbrial protein n=1 Tax=Rosenbergiella nectarea TaxID=988801 RepID=UPI001F4E5F98